VLTIFTLSLSEQTKSSGQQSDETKCKWGRHNDSAPAIGTVKITPLGSHAGEFCRNDRALLFEDPTGVRILWDPGRTVNETDNRLGGRIDLVLLSSTHGDHMGDAKPSPSSAGTCAAPATISAAPNPTTATIAAAKNSAVFAGGEMGDYLARQIQSLRGIPTPTCAASGVDNEMTVPLNAPCVGTLRPGGSRSVRLASASSGVSIANIQTFHSNGIPSAFVDAPSYGGNDGGAVIRFSNDLVVYLTADTGLFGDMKTVVKDYYGAELVVVNLGDPNCLGPDEAAYAINNFLTPNTVIPSHINEAATSGGNAVGARLQKFIPQVNRKTAVEIPLSGVVMEFDGRGRRVNK
jgi:L-ascorbate metabolism protein UlaG (beta-lactamase superfamily)